MAKPNGIYYYNNKYYNNIGYNAIITIIKQCKYYLKSGRHTVWTNQIQNSPTKSHLQENLLVEKK